MTQKPRPDAYAPTWALPPELARRTACWPRAGDGPRPESASSSAGSNATGWSETRAQLGELDVIPPRQATYAGSIFPELDVDGVLVAQPDLVLVDEWRIVSPTRGDGAGRTWPNCWRRGSTSPPPRTWPTWSFVRDYVARLTGVGVVESIPDQLCGQAKWSWCR